jgi:di/tricarboxylate transporter
VALWITGILDLGQALAGFGDPTVIFIASLFVVSEALDATGVTAWAGRQVIGRAGTKRTPLLLVVCLLVAGRDGAHQRERRGRRAHPVVVVVATRAGLPPSQMLMPLAFSAHAGSLLALTGTPGQHHRQRTAAADARRGRSASSSSASWACRWSSATLLVIAVLGRRLLPERAPTTLPQDVSEHARVPARAVRAARAHRAHRRAPGGHEVVVAPRSDLIGLHLFPGMVTPSGDLVVLAVAARRRRTSSGRTRGCRRGDTLLLSGGWDELQRNTSGPDVLVVDDPSGCAGRVPLGAGVEALDRHPRGDGRAPRHRARARGDRRARRGIRPGAHRGGHADAAYRSISWTTVVLVAA